MRLHPVLVFSVAALALLCGTSSGQVLTSNCAGCDATFTSTYDDANCSIVYKVVNNNFSDDICFLLEGIPFGRKVLDDGECVTNPISGVDSVTVATSSFCCGAEITTNLTCANCDDFICSAAYHKPHPTPKTSSSYHSELFDTLGPVNLSFDSSVSGNTITYTVTNLSATSATVTWDGTGIVNQPVSPGGFVQANASGPMILAAFAQVRVDGSAATGLATAHFASGTPVPAMGAKALLLLLGLVLAAGAILVVRTRNTSV